jgi:hypothetical protein
VLYQTDDIGNVTELLNEAEVQQQTQKVMDEVLDLVTEPEARSAMEKLLDMIMTPEVIAEGALEDAYRLHYAFGGEYKLGEKLRGEVEIPNPLGDEPLPGHVTMTMNTLDAAKEVATFTMELKIDPEKLEAAVEKVITALIAASDADGEFTKEYADEMRKMLREMKWTETMNITVDLKGAVVTTLVNKEETTVAGQREVETFEYRLVR